MTEIPQEYKLTDELKEKIAKLFWSAEIDLGEGFKLTPVNWEKLDDKQKQYLLTKAGEILSVAMPLIEKRAREEVVAWVGKHTYADDYGTYLLEVNDEWQAQLKAWNIKE